MDYSKWRQSTQVEDAREPDDTPNRYNETIGSKLGDVYRHLENQALNDLSDAGGLGDDGSTASERIGGQRSYKRGGPVKPRRPQRMAKGGPVKQKPVRLAEGGDPATDQEPETHIQNMIGNDAVYSQPGANNDTNSSDYYGSVQSQEFGPGDKPPTVNGVPQDTGALDTSAPQDKAAALEAAQNTIYNAMQYGRQLHGLPTDNQQGALPNPQAAPTAPAPMPMAASSIPRPAPDNNVVTPPQNNGATEQNIYNPDTGATPPQYQPPAKTAAPTQMTQGAIPGVRPFQSLGKIQHAARGGPIRLAGGGMPDIANSNAISDWNSSYTAPQHSPVMPAAPTPSYGGGGNGIQTPAAPISSSGGNSVDPWNNTGSDGGRSLGPDVYGASSHDVQTPAFPAVGAGVRSSNRQTVNSILGPPPGYFRRGGPVPPRGRK